MKVRKRKAPQRVWLVWPKGSENFRPNTAYERHVANLCKASGHIVHEYRLVSPPPRRRKK